MFESNYHEYILQYDDIYENMSLTLKEAYYTEETKWVHNHTTIEKYNITPSMYADISIIILRDHLHITKKRMRNDRYKNTYLKYNHK